MDEKQRGALRERYAPKPNPKCWVCGAELSVAAMGGNKATVWACMDREGPQDKAWSEHYSLSRFEVVDHSDYRVIELLDAYEATLK